MKDFGGRLTDSGQVVMALIKSYLSQRSVEDGSKMRIADGIA